MDDFAQMDIFFVVTTAAVVVTAIALGTVLFYVARVMRNVDRITKNVGEEAELVRGDIAELRKNIREEGMKWKHMTTFLSRVGGRANARKTRVRPTKHSGGDKSDAE